MATDIPDPLPPLTAAQHRFCEEYLVDLCAKDAAQRAGYAGRRAKQTGYELLRRPQVRAEIDRLMAERAAATRIQAYRVLEELAHVALSNVDDFEIDETGRVAVREGVPQSAMRAVAKIRRRRRVEHRKNGEKVETFETELALWDKNAAIANGMRHLGLTKERLEVSGPDGGPIEVDTVDLRQRIIDRVKQLGGGS